MELQTSNFEKQCEGLLLAQKRDLELADGIQYNLQYYDFLDPASRKLNAPRAGSSVRTKEFSDMLRRLDECLDYMEVHVRNFSSFTLPFIMSTNAFPSLSKKRRKFIAPGINCF